MSPFFSTFCSWSERNDSFCFRNFFFHECVNRKKMCVNACWYFDVPRIEKCEESHVAISLISFLIKNKTNYFSWPSSFSPSNRFPCFFLFVWWKTVFHSLFPNHTTREKITGTCGSQAIPVGFLFHRLPPWCFVESWILFLLSYHLSFLSVYSCILYFPF